MRKALFLLGIVVFAIGASAQVPTEGALQAADKNGKPVGACPLKNTTVKTDISGFLARVRVRQEFENPFDHAIEAVYTFPLSQNGAVDDMTMTIGTRIVRGKIMKREEARQVYEAAKDEGRTASLLDQERPNIFTQSVANIMPGENVVVEISYVETLKYEDGAYEFVFPMTVGPRYNPASVGDASKISPPVAAGRPGHGISIEVNLNAGVPVEEIRSTSHDIQQVNFNPHSAKINLKNEVTIPNKDFVVRYDVTGGKIQDAVLVHRGERGGFFTMILQPPDKIASEDRTPKEIVFVLDTSGSMYGFPIEKAKEAMVLSLEGLYPDDTFNLITFAGDTHVLFEEPVPATRGNIERALAFLESRTGGGGTEMMRAIRVALDPSDSKSHLRIVCFMTDGYVGNEDEIIAEVQKHPNARVFSFGIGNSVNRHLLDKMAEAGRGEVEYVSLTDDGSKAAKRFYERVRTPLLTDLSIDWNGAPVADVYPAKLGDLFSAKPVIVHGRYTKNGGGTIKLKGKVAGQPYEREIKLDLPEREAANDSLASLWARTRIDELSSDKLRAENASRIRAYEKEILNLGLEFRLMTKFTSFVAVEDRIVNRNGKPVTVQVPVSIPEGVDPVMSGASVDRYGDPNASYAALSNSAGGGGGVDAMVTVDTKRGRSKRKSAKSGSVSGSGTGVGYGSGGGSGDGNGNGSGSVAKPPPPVAASTTSSVVNVSASPAEIATVESTGSQVSTTVTQQSVATLPLGRSFSSLLTISPGAFQIDGARSSENSFVIDGVDAGRTIAMVEPVYPAEAKAANVLGEVEVEVKIDREGTVYEATAISDPEPLRAASEIAAKLSKFAPSFVEGRAVRISGSVVYKYVSPEKTEIFIRKMKIAPATEEDKIATRLADKSHFWIYDAVVRVSKGDAIPSANESKFVRDGKAFIRIVLLSKTPGVIEKLKAAGVEIATDKGNMLTGSIPLGKLGGIAAINEVKYVSPQF